MCLRNDPGRRRRRLVLVGREVDTLPRPPDTTCEVGVPGSIVGGVPAKHEEKVDGAAIDLCEERLDLEARLTRLVNRRFDIARAGAFESARHGEREGVRRGWLRRSRDDEDAPRVCDEILRDRAHPAERGVRQANVAR